MTERNWVKSIIGNIEKELRKANDNIRVKDNFRLSYANEVISYDNDNNAAEQNSLAYETDILVYELIDELIWKPRVIIEAKLNRVTTHDAITYSKKAQSHKYVHPFLRYGILIGNRKHYPLPGRLFRHGENFDFMQSWKAYEADEKEMDVLIKIITDEIHASQMLEEILFNSRSRNREHFTSLHRPLRLGK